jgi:hypothetical protein
MNRALVVLALLTAGANAQPVQPMPQTSSPVGELLASAPHVEISNGLVTARITPPDPDNGFYNGTRFDQAGIVTSLTLNGKEFYGPYFARTAPEVLDYTYDANGATVAGPDSAVSGPVEEFAPLGFDDRTTALFVKIGVGVLYRPDDAPYDHYRHYHIVSMGTRSTRVAPDSVTFLQTVDGANYGYTYQKTLRLVPGKPQMVIEHVLRNSGDRPIVTTVYDHNFLRLTPGDDGIQLRFPFTVAAANPPAADLMRVDGRTLTYLRAMKPRERASFPITGYGASAGDYDIQVTDLKSKAGVQIKGDQPITKINVFSIDTVQAVEPYIAIDLPPGAEKRWSYTYTYTAAH